MGERYLAYLDVFWDDPLGMVLMDTYCMKRIDVSSHGVSLLSASGTKSFGLRRCTSSAGLTVVQRP